MPIFLLEAIAKAGVMLLEYVLKNWTGPEKTIVLKQYDTPCTVDCKKRGIEPYEQ